MSRSSRIARTVFFACGLNFAVWFLMRYIVGGDALTGHEKDGHYYLGQWYLGHLHLTETGWTIWTYSWWHTGSVWVVGYPVMLLAWLWAWVTE